MASEDKPVKAAKAPLKAGHKRVALTHVYKEGKQVYQPGDVVEVHEDVANSWVTDDGGRIVPDETPLRQAAPIDEND